MNIRTTLIASSLVAASVITSTAHAALLPRDLDGNQTTAEAYYDTDRNITWLADSLYALSSGYNADGRMTWDEAKAWVANLSFTDGVNVYGDWRLPTFTDTGTPGCNHAYSDTDCGYNVNTATGEMAHLFYDELGNKALYDIAGVTPQPGWGLVNKGPFRMIRTVFWYGSEDPTQTIAAFFFNVYNGAQGANTPKTERLHAWPVSPGDVGQPVYSNIPPLANAGAGQTVPVGTFVTLNGTGSSDQDNHNPLTYAWTLVSAPFGSVLPELIAGGFFSNTDWFDLSSISPIIATDVVGDYVLSLTVTDSLGLASTPAQVTISTYNTAPVAAAGSDQAILLVGSVVQLDGSQSFDDDGNPFTARWTFTSKPSGSNATLSNAAALNPTFVADVHGNYVLSLTAKDSFGGVSAPDSVTIAFDNVVPVAHAGNNQASDTGMTMVLDGTASSDANNDNLTYSWSFANKPATSAATIANPGSDRPSFVADAAGTYVVSLVVNDGTAASLPSTVEIVIVDSAVSVVRDLQDDINIINTLNPASFNNVNNQNALTNKLNSVITLIQDAIASGNADLYQSAIDKLTNDVLKKTDGCAVGGKPDKNDWIKNCTDQNTVYPLIIDAIQKLQSLL